MGFLDGFHEKQILLWDLHKYTENSGFERKTVGGV